MATQTIEFAAVSGRNLVARLFPLGSDAQTGPDTAATEQTNRKGLYLAAWTDAPAGDYLLHAFDVATSRIVAIQRVKLLAETGTYREWSDAMLQAIFDKPAAELSPEDLAEISGAIVDALAAEGVTVNQLTAEAIAQLATKRAFYLLSPLNECGRYRIVRGQDCFAVDGRALDLPNPQGDWPNLTGASIKVTFSTGTTSLTLDGSVVVPTGSGQLVRGEPASAFTQQLTEGDWTLDFEAVLQGTAHVVPLGRFKLEVLRRNRPL